MTNMYSVTERRGTRNLQIRFYVPERYQAAFGKKEVTRSLGTPDQRVANELAPGVAAEILAQIKAAQPQQQRPEPQPIEPTAQQIDQAARYVYACLVQSDQEELLDVPLVETGDRGTAASAAAHRRHADEAKQAALHGDFSHTMLDHWCDEFGFAFGEGSPTEKRFQQKLSWAYSEAAKRWAEHDEGIYGAESVNALFKGIVIAGEDESDFPQHPSHVQPPRETRKGTEKPAEPAVAPDWSQPPLMDLWPVYERQRGARVSNATNDEKQIILQMFADFVGPSRPTDSITKQDAISWRDALTLMPASASQRKEFKGKPLAEIIELNKQAGHPTLSPVTINKYLSAVSSFYGWLVDEGRVSANIWKGLRIEVDDEDNKRPPFTIDQLQALFNSPLFTGCASDKDITTRMSPGQVQIRNWRFWAPLLAAFTGARQSELLQLEVADIRRGDGIDYIFITDEGSDPHKRLKTRHAKRSIPVHSKLIELGFLNYVATQVRKGETRLFSELRRNAKGNFNNAQRELNKPIHYMDFPPDDDGNKRVFHSFRHNVTDELRRSYAPHDFQPLIGHAESGVTRRYGVAEDLGLKRRQEIIEEIRYPGLNLSKISPYQTAVSG